MRITLEIKDVMYRPDGTLFLFHEVTSGPKHLKGQRVTSQIKEEKLTELINAAKKETGAK